MHYRQARIYLPNMAKGSDLHLYDGPVIGRIRDLEQVPPPVRCIGPEVLVSFAREAGQGRLQTEGVLKDLPGRLFPEGRRPARQRIWALHRSHRVPQL